MGNFTWGIFLSGGRGLKWSDFDHLNPSQGFYKRATDFWIFGVEHRRGRKILKTGNQHRRKLCVGRNL